MQTRRKAVLAAEAKPTWLLALDDDLLRSIAAFLSMPTLVDFTAVNRRRAADRESGTHARTCGEAVSGPPSRHPMYGSWAPRI